MGDSPGEMRLEIGQASPILAADTVCETVMNDRFEAVELGPWHVDVPIQNDPGGSLRDGLTHYPRLAGPDLESFFQRDGAGRHIEAIDYPLKAFAAGEDQVVR